MSIDVNFLQVNQGNFNFVDFNNGLTSNSVYIITVLVLLQSARRSVNVNAGLIQCYHRKVLES